MHLINQNNQKYLENYKKEVFSFFDGELTGERLKEYQSKKFVSILRYVHENCIYYKNMLDKLDLDLDSVTLNDLGKIPFTTKDTLREQGLSMLSQPIEKNAYYYETTGTTGAATPCPRSMIDVMSSNITISLAYKTVFESVFGERKPVVGVFGPTEVHSFGDTLGNVCHNLDMCVVKAWPYSPVIGFEKSLELMKKLNIEVIMCTPGLSMTLYKACKSFGYDIKKDFNIKMFMLTGEMCTEPMAKNIEHLWGAKVFNFMYGSQEALVMATCNSENRMNIFPHNYIYEVINPETGISMGFDGEGELVVTMLNPGGKPLIRYRTGDTVRISNNSKSPLPSKEIEIMGRIKDRIRLNNELYKASDFEIAILEGINDCLGYQIIIDQNAAREDWLEIKLEMLDSLGESDSSKAKIKENFKNKFNVEVVINFEKELNPIIYTGAMVSWKAARIVDKRIEKKSDNSEKDAAYRIIEQGIVKTV